MAVDEMHLPPLEVPLLKLACGEAFKKLTKRERLYAHHMSRASWLGSRICLEQKAPSVPQIFDMFQLAFSEKSYDRVEHADAAELAAFYSYAVSFYGQLGNYAAFGDRKFVPRIGAEVFGAILLKHAEQLKGKGKKQAVQDLWSKVKDSIYALEPKDKQLGKPHEATSGYYLGDVSAEDVAFVSRFMQAHKLEAWNTRLAKDEDGALEIRCAAFEPKGSPLKVEPFEFEGRQVRVRYGDYGALLGPVISHLRKAKAYAANPTQEEMLKHYVEHFETGELQKHKDSQAAWVKDLSPAVETNIGFIENYRDGYGERSEFEGLVSMVNRDQSRKFDALVSKAEDLLFKLPWPREFEKDSFHRPDFTALDVLTFACTAVPVGINIPNYDDIRAAVGFKNVHLHNVLSSRYADTADVPFIRAEEQAMFKALRAQAFEVQVGLHELLGHGSGKMLARTDVEGKELPDPVNKGRTITGFYEEGQTWSSVFKALANPWEECRAETVGIYLCLERPVLEIFGYSTAEEQDDIIHCNWLSMVHAGLSGLEVYSPEAKKWGQAHMHARFAILNVLLRAGQDFVKLEVDHAASTASISLDRSKIESVGRPAIGDFLLKLQVLRSTADVAAATAVFEDLTKVDEEWLKVREVVLKHRKPRPIYVQAHTVEEENGQVRCLEFTPTVKGLLLSMQYHFGEPAVATAKAPTAKASTAKAPKGDAASETTAQLKRPKYTKVSALTPDASGLNLRLKVVSAPAAVGDRSLKEVVVGDASGVITMTLRGDALLEALGTVGAAFTVRNGKVSMVKGHMRLDVDKWGKVVLGADEGGSFDFEPKTGNDLSAAEYELVAS